MKGRFRDRHRATSLWLVFAERVLQRFRFDVRIVQEEKRTAASLLFGLVLSPEANLPGATTNR